MSKIISASKLYLGYKKEESVIKNAAFEIKAKEFVFISGPSGSGKSTLLKSLYGALCVHSGSLNVCGIEMLEVKKRKIDFLRRHIGIVFQDYKLIKEWTIEKNVMLPMIINGFSKEACQAQAERLLAHIKLSHKAGKYPPELSGGEQQRVAMARALAHNPLLILADEPTGNLDDYSSDVIWNLLKGVNEQLGISVVVVTHRIPDNLNIPYRHLYIEDGVVYELS
ncbi:cell division ATP-binding protein FtsE [Wolinella succinogenes]|uniref:CELL DIVISION PROTEIN FTSE n=1 Tax=Wolinella succinogenes (strain ATCC 29543 / DSM 1740 / CCUG 13145 / JCM 31913 / LMG 7466 / NCTC 11488 / FDC 602W) TaxID=273121 RepID=Q7MAM4_WOLSU|nr:ABC transporter ATP-binding protein [Wolinella succinogenes]NLU35259.1 ABC transporter ATP-binding protein [Wolinella succinogenes]CAE09309.1 CELL DIVISION PROTEIN FTSE [Wolinella succinogenes]VEG81521.1 Cell division ATP-binding protein FtsE [Wolinella succinogenes]HCZ18832.1 ABC transporter ATP-binding protein [Helicobacter sp.]